MATDRSLDYIKRVKCMIFGTIADPEVDLRRPSFQIEYPMIASDNLYDWLSDGLDEPLLPDQNLILWDKSTNPSQSVASYVKLSKTTEGAMNATVRQGNVERMSLQDLCATIEDVLGSFCSLTDPDVVIASVQPQPSLHRVLLDTTTNNNFQHLCAKAFGNAVLREISTQPCTLDEECCVIERMSTLYPGQQNLDFQTAVSRPSAILLKLRLAEADLCLQIIAPSICADPLKLSALTGKSGPALPHPH